MQTIQRNTTEIDIRDPLKRFPYDVWVNCICFVAYGEVVGPLPLLSVSKEWQKSIIETPEVWTSIVIDNGEDTLARVNLLLQFSKNLLIDLHIPYPTILWEALRLVLREKVRIRAIIVTRSSPKYPGTLSFRELLDFLEVGSESYPQMEEYIVDGYQGHGDYDFLCRCPKLVRVQFLLKNTVFPIIKLKHLQGKPTEFPIIITDTDNIKIFDEVVYLTSPSLDNMRGLDKIQPQFQKVSRYFESLGYVMPRDGQIGSFLSTVYPRLHSLTVLMPPVSSQAVISSIHLFPKLKNLDLGLRFADSASAPRTLKPVDGPQLHTFTLRSHAPVKSQDVENVVNDLAQSRILQYARSLTFELVNGVASATLMNLLQTTPHIQILTIHRYYNDSIGHIPVTLPKLEILNTNSPNYFWYLDVPNLSILYLIGTLVQLNHKIEWKGEKLTSLSTTSDSFDKLRDQMLQDNPERQLFPSLTHIKWADYDLNQGFQTTLLASITCVAFDSPTDYGGSTKMAPIDAFCLSILQYTDACPVLESIMSREYPCWDLFLQVLQLRNDNPHVRNMKSVGFPGYPVFFILDLLIHVLNGGGDKIGEIEEVMQKRLESRNNSCIQCLLAGYIYCRITDQTDEAVPSVEEEETSSGLLDDLRLPIITAPHRRAQAEPKGLKQGSEWWIQLIQGRSFEEASLAQMCSRHSNVLTTVTRYTLN